MSFWNNFKTFGELKTSPDSWYENFGQTFSGHIGFEDEGVK